MESSPLLVPPFRFAAVENGVYRGAYPTLRNLRFLQRLRLATVVCISPEAPTSDLDEFCRQHKVALVHVAAPFYNEGPTLSPEAVARLLELLVRPEAHPLYVHCLTGTHNTSLVIACLRKLQHWDPAAVRVEFARFCDEPMEGPLLAFYESFSYVVRVPKAIPSWLWEGNQIARHPTMRIQSSASAEAAWDHEEEHKARREGGDPSRRSQSPGPQAVRGRSEAPGRSDGRGASVYFDTLMVGEETLAFYRSKGEERRGPAPILSARLQALALEGSQAKRVADEGALLAAASAVAAGTSSSSSSAAAAAAAAVASGTAGPSASVAAPASVSSSSAPSSSSIAPAAAGSTELARERAREP